MFDTRTDEQVGQFAGFGQAPDLMDVSPDGGRVFMSLRGPNNLTGGPPAKGETPGLAVLDVRDGGRTGQRAFFVADRSAGRARPGRSRTRIAVRRLAQQAVAPVVAPTQLPRTGAPGAELLLLAGGGLALLGASGLHGASRRRRRLRGRRRLAGACPRPARPAPRPGGRGASLGEAGDGLLEAALPAGGVADAAGGQLGVAGDARGVAALELAEELAPAGPAADRAQDLEHAVLVVARALDRRQRPKGRAAGRSARRHAAAR